MKFRWICLIGAALLGLLLFASPAFAYNEGGSTDPSKTGCTSCHGGSGRQGPHGGYDAGTAKCETCHAVHNAPSNSAMLLPKATITDTCDTCHDGTGGDGVYGTIAARGLTPGGGHAVDTTNTVPEGDPVTGGSSRRTFGGVNGTLGCDDCHSPHDANTVSPFIGDRLRTADSTTPVASDRLLRRQPTGAPYAVSQYGSDWCGTCHLGSITGTGGHNHPVETSATAGEYTYNSVPSLASSTSASTVLAPLGQSNFGYIMPDPRTPMQQGHAPICQQCHEDSRDVGSAGAAKPFTVTQPDGTSAADDPRFQNFPHETVNTNMLIENGDDLCTNCHSPSQLP